MIFIFWWITTNMFVTSRIPLCSVINEHIRCLANKFPMVKFIKSLAGLCIPNYPDQNLPTIFIYHNGELKHQFIGSNSFTPALKQNGTQNVSIIMTVSNELS